MSNEILYPDILESKWLNSNKINLTDSVLMETYFNFLTDSEGGLQLETASITHDIS